MTGSEADSRSQARRHAAMVARLQRSGYVALGVFAGSVGLWSATASISSAVIAPATFVVENNVKKVQHPSGGVVGQILVREGQRVRQGELLLRLDDAAARANLQIVSWQIDEARARAARLEAERDQAPGIAFPASLSARAGEREMALLLASETRLFEARARARDGMRAQLAKRIQQLRSEIDGLSGQRAAREREAAVSARELENIRALHARRLVPMNRLSQLERDAAALEGARGQLGAQIAQLEGRIAETELQIIQIDEDLRAEALRDLRQIEASIAELGERRVGIEDQVRRMDLLAPASGHVHQLAVSNAGSVVNPGDPILLIVPSEEQLHLEARISPADYDQVHLGQEAIIRIHAFNQRTTPELRGAVSRMAPDVSREPQTGLASYTIRVAILRDEFVRLDGVEIKAGMQADVFIKTGERSPSSYLLKPLTDQAKRAFRER